MAPIVEWLDENPDPFTLHELMVGALRLNERDMDREANRLGRLLRRLGYDSSRKRVPSGRAWVWVRVIEED